MATQREVKPRQDRGFLVDAYASRFGEPRSDQEAHGYWIFALGLVLGFLGLVVLAFSTMPEPRSSAAFNRRQIAAILGGIGMPLLMLGVVYRLPIKKTADRVALLGTLVCIAALVAFVVYYPFNWNVASGSEAADYSAIITGVYGIGLLIIGFAALVMPSIVESRQARLEEREDEVFEREGKVTGREEEVTRREEEVSEREDRVAEEPAMSKAKFEMFKDKKGEWRWHLRHQNGNILADSGEGYSTKQKAKQGLESVRKNLTGAPITEREDVTEEGTTDVGEEE
ncbi:MAG: HVO_2922 family protein [Halobacteriales archaeon]|nr:HVO_2922 family protein [Halobacteriales archaeon]